MSGKIKISANDEVTLIDPFGNDKKLLPTDTIIIIIDVLFKY